LISFVITNRLGYIYAKSNPEIATKLSMMENYLQENFGGVKSKNSSEEALRRWRDVCGFVKNPKRRFRFTANLDKRGEAAAMRRTNQVSFFYYSTHVR
jgi:hypothetical protein